MFRSRFLLTAAVAVAAALAAPAVSQAAFQIRLEAGSENATIDLTTGKVLSATGGSGFTAGSTLATSNPGAGSGNYLFFAPGSFGSTFASLQFRGYLIQTESDVNNHPGTQVMGNLYLGTTQVTNVSAGASPAALKISVTDTDYTLPSAVNRYIETTFNGTVTNSTAVADLYSYYANGTTPFDTAVNVAGEDLHAQATQGHPASGAPVTSPSFAATGPYTLTNSIVITGLSTGQVATASVDQVVHAPAPPGLVMLVGAVPFFGLIRRRLRKSEVATVA